MVDWGKSRRLGENATLSLRHPPHGSHGLMRLWIRTSYQINNVGTVHTVGSRKGTGSLSDGVIGIFLWCNPSGRTMSLVWAQPLIEMGTSNISWGGGKGVQCVWLRTLPLACVDCLEIWEPQPPGNHRASPGLCRDCFTCTFSREFSLRATCGFVRVYNGVEWDIVSLSD